jgi:hypothetical protein
MRALVQGRRGRLQVISGDSALRALERRRCRVRDVFHGLLDRALRVRIANAFRERRRA